MKIFFRKEVLIKNCLFKSAFEKLLIFEIGNFDMFWIDVFVRQLQKTPGPTIFIILNYQTSL